MKKVICLLLIILLALPALVACKAQSSEWAVYLYLCGSTLESESGNATNNLVELAAAKLPKGAKIIVQTGGASEWKTKGIASDALERWVIEDGQMKKLDTLENASMGSAQTLTDFLSFCRSTYPAKKEALIFWDHGGGSLPGVCFDQNYHNDALSLPEIDAALSKSAQKYPEPLEMIGFDACLMATLETADTLAPYANYMVASEETEPMAGWNYTALAEKLTGDRNGAELGRAICDGYYQKCKDANKDANATLSVVDLKKIPAAAAALDELSAKLLENMNGFKALGTVVRAADGAQKFGGTNNLEGYSNLIDIGNFCNNLSSETLKKTVSDAVVYSVDGRAKKDVSGLSFYYPIHIDQKQLITYRAVCKIDGYADYLEKIYANIPKNTIEWIDKGSVDEEGHLRVQVQNSGFLLKAEIYLIALLPAEDKPVLENVFGLGSSDQVTVNMETGTLTDCFDGTWPTLNGCVLHVTQTEPGRGIYSAPVLVNGEQTNLRFMKNGDGTYSILGTWKGIDPVLGIADKDIRQLKTGDVITPLYEQRYTQDFTTKLIPGEKIEFDETMKIENTKLDASHYFQYVYVLTDIYGNKHISNTAVLDFQNGLPNISVITETNQEVFGDF